MGAGGVDITTPLVLLNILDSPHVDTRQFVFLPVRCSGSNGTYFVFTISGIQFLVKFGGRNGLITYGDTYSPLLRILPGRNVQVIHYPFEDSAEAKWMTDVAARA
jgi:hypothetical protein